MIATIVAEQNVTSEVPETTVNAIISAIAIAYNVTESEINYSDKYTVAGTIDLDLGNSTETEVLATLQTELGNDRF